MEHFETYRYIQGTRQCFRHVAGAPENSVLLYLLFLHKFPVGGRKGSLYKLMCYYCISPLYNAGVNNNCIFHFLRHRIHRLTSQGKTQESEEISMLSPIMQVGYDMFKEGLFFSELF